MRVAGLGRQKRETRVRRGPSWARHPTSETPLALDGQCLAIVCCNETTAPLKKGRQCGKALGYGSKRKTLKRCAALPFALGTVETNDLVSSGLLVRFLSFKQKKKNKMFFKMFFSRTSI
jgi:hypothetical protein